MLRCLVTSITLCHVREPFECRLHPTCSPSFNCKCRILRPAPLRHVLMLVHIHLRMYSCCLLTYSECVRTCIACRYYRGAVGALLVYDIAKRVRLCLHSAPCCLFQLHSQAVVSSWFECALSPPLAAPLSRVRPPGTERNGLQ